MIKYLQKHTPKDIQKHNQNNNRQKNQLENKMLGDDVKPKRKIPDISLVDFLGDEYMNIQYPPKI